MTTAAEIRRDLIADALKAGGMSLGQLVAMESNLREAQGLPGRIPELDGIATPPELSFQRSGACGPAVQADALALHHEWAGWIETTAPAEPAPTNERHDTMESPDTRQGTVTLASGSDIPRGIISTAPRSESGRDALARATAGIAVTVDEFTDDQLNAFHAFNLSDPNQTEWLDELTAQEARNVLDLLQSVTDEHRRRANATDSLQEMIRQRFSVVAQWNNAPAIPNRG